MAVTRIAPGERLLDARRRLGDTDEAARLRRIHISAPPAATFDGQLHRFREERRLAVTSEPDYETVWDGTMGRHGASLIGDRSSRPR